MKSTAGNDGVLLLQTTTSGGTATTAVTLDNNQNMGLGVTPSAWTYRGFQVGGAASVWSTTSGQGSTYLSNNLFFDGARKYINNGYASEYEQGNSQHIWKIGASGTAGGTVSLTQAMTLDASGNLGIGTTSPNIGGYSANSRVLTVQGVSGSYGVAELSSNSANSDGTYVGRLDFSSAGQASGYQNIASIASFLSGSTSTKFGSTLQFFTRADNAGSGSPTERARINSSGFFKATNTGGYIGSTGPYYEFISSDVSTNQTFIIYNNSSSITQEALFFIGAARATTNNTFYAIGYYNYGSGTYKFRVADSGNVTNTNNSYGAISDIKLKENITDATPKLEQLNQVRVVNYNFIGSNEKQLGVIAQELEQIFPGMVEESPDTERVTTVGEDGQEVTNDVPTGTTTKSVKYSVFVPMLIKAIQEQQAIITQLQADVAALKGTP